ncbi:MAG: hypothetical protein QM809_04390 [Gordonia sp. (in: high G+C Gram-positive bacteria)]|uniref:hypothetical protein n=1 Tax=Gordonia sp. (in: high G+C Gram-positive bacteria) TaxID=84139 RepID=UPI0039E33674
MLGRAVAAATTSIALVGVLAACGSSDPEAAPEKPAVSLPPTYGPMPWGADLQGFGDRKDVRCAGTDQAIRMTWSGDHRFLVCRPAGGAKRYLLAWTSDGPTRRGEKNPDMRLFKAPFVNLTPKSVQFETSDGDLFDIGKDTMTIEWKRQKGSKTKRFTSIRTGEGWSRLD